MLESPAAVLRIDLLGSPGWRCASVSGRLEGKFAPLVARVVVAGRQPRDALARLLWPGDLRRANDNLRQHVRRLRAATGHDVLVQGESVSAAAGVECDVWGRPLDWPAETLLQCGEFLAGEDPDRGFRQ